LQKLAMFGRQDRMNGDERGAFHGFAARLLVRDKKRVIGR
jgi:hypothetical protein